jgi:hypothetical protein
VRARAAWAALIGFIAFVVVCEAPPFETLSPRERPIGGCSVFAEGVNVGDLAVYPERAFLRNDRVVFFRGNLIFRRNVLLMMPSRRNGARRYSTFAWHLFMEGIPPWEKVCIDNGFVQHLKGGRLPRIFNDYLNPGSPFGIINLYDSNPLGKHISPQLPLGGSFGVPNKLSGYKYIFFGGVRALLQGFNLLGYLFELGGPVKIGSFGFGLGMSKLSFASDVQSDCGGPQAYSRNKKPEREEGNRVGRRPLPEGFALLALVAAVLSGGVTFLLFYFGRRIRGLPTEYSDPKQGSDKEADHDFRV